MLWEPHFGFTYANNLCSLKYEGVIKFKIAANRKVVRIEYCKIWSFCFHTARTGLVVTQY